MPSSTFSFKLVQVPILQIIFLVVLVVAYHCIIVGFKIKQGEVGTPAKHNVVTIERYELKRKPARAIALGSSILNRVMNRLGTPLPDFENLCLVGYSAIDGMAVIRHRSRYPKLAVVELSLVLAKKDHLDVEAEVPAYKMWLARFTPVMRCEFQPSTILLRILQQNIREKPRPKPAPRDEIKFGYRKSLVRDNFPHNMKLLRTAVKDLERHGTTVCFVVVPHAPSIMTEGRARHQRELFEKFFPKSKYRWIEWSGPPRKWNAPDGWHLNNEDATLFGEDMLRQLWPIWKSLQTNKSSNDRSSN